jgi:LysM repeat protein
MRRIISLIALFLAACSAGQPRIVVVTSTPSETTSLNPTPLIQVSPPPEQPLSNPTADQPHGNAVQNSPGGREYVVQPGDTLTSIAAANGVSVQSLLTANRINDPNIIGVGQVILLPGLPDKQTPDFKIIPNSRLVRGPGSANFDIAAFIRQMPGYIHVATDTVNDELLSAADVVRRVSLEYSVDARLLLALLEYRARWLTTMELTDDEKIYAMEGQPSPPGFDRKGLYKQLAWAANLLNRGYYDWKYRGVQTLEFSDGARFLFAKGLNPGTVGVQFFLSQNTDYTTWLRQVGLQGFYSTYVMYFGDPFAGAVEPLVPSGMAQPVLNLPFSRGETWFFTGGHHGGWGSGSAWAAVDFAPPDDRPAGSAPCYVSQFWATAVAAGVIARSNGGAVLLDLDGDGDESTGWTVMYLHMASDGRVPLGTVVQPGDHIGHPSCEGGFSNATHMHIARRYNGEWLPVTCDACTAGEIPPFMMGGWTFFGFTDQEYQGYMLNGTDRRNAEQGRNSPDNRVSW